MIVMDRKQVFSWALYDWANSAFITAITASFFPIFFKEFWSAGVDPADSSFRLGLANSMSSLVVLFMAPILGAIADQGAFKKRFLVFFTALGIVMTAGLHFVDQGLWLLAAILFIFASIGFAGANIFYDALLLDVSGKQQLDQVSGLGYGLGYLGGGLFFAICVYLTQRPDLIGLENASQVISITFLATALWWAVFSIPIVTFVKEHKSISARIAGGSIRGGFRQLRITFQKVRRLRMVGLFLLAYWLYIDAVDTIIRMAVDYGMAIGLPSQSLIIALLLTQFVGFPAAIAFGFLGQKIGAKQGILIGLGVYILITVWGSRIQQSWEFYSIAVLIGLVQGGVQSLSRSLYARLIPVHAAAEFFGFYNMLGKFAAVIGPLMMGWIAMKTGDHRLSILSLLLLFITGAVLLMFVDTRETAEDVI